MSAGDVVFTGWLIKSPPEKKLKRFAWRKRWFVLRRGRMSGNPDVLEYYRNKTSKKPIRTIDLRESEVQMQTEQRLVKREFQNQHLFVVKTSSRIFYLVAKTEEEMNTWVYSISQICHFASLDDGTEEQLPNTPTSEKPSPALSFSSSHDRVAMPSPPESFHPPDYLFLSQCETGERLSISRCDSFSNSERSLEQNSSDNTIDSFSSLLCTDPFPSPFAHTGPCPSPFPHMRVTDPPFSAPCAPTSYERPRDFSSSSSSPRTLHRTPDIFQFDKPYPSADGLTPPPLPPKPGHLSEQQAEEGPQGALAVGGQPVLLPRRISMSSLDHFRRGDVEGCAMRTWNKRLSLNLSTFIATPSPNIQEDSYVPMASPSLSAGDDVLDGYIPMSPTCITLHNSSSGTEPHPPLGPPGELAPPPVNRNLKPRRRTRPPPLDLRELSTIREYPTHLPLNRTMTEPSNSIFLLERRQGKVGIKDQEASSIPIESRLFIPTTEGAVQPWVRRSNLDYLSLDFNSASPSPVQKKPLLADEHRVDYVKVDEKKTQALQNTKMEWKDVRQSKV